MFGVIALSECLLFKWETLPRFAFCLRVYVFVCLIVLTLYLAFGLLSKELNKQSIE
jgi:hypothetical protein